MPSKIVLGVVVVLVVGLAVGAAAGYLLQDAQSSSLKRDAKYWQQAKSIMMPVTLKTMTDHMAFISQDGKMMIAYHFDDMDLSKAENLNWIAIGVAGKWCKEDQQRIENEFGPGFTHFHDLLKDTHGGTIVGQDGFWFKHVAVREFNAPWGSVQPGVDTLFMPTVAPNCTA